MPEKGKMPGVAIIGRPNVGKSALFNRLIKRQIAIVHDQPGITRDRLSAICKLGARPFAIWDTGGVVGAGEVQLTKQVRQVVEEAIRDSDLILFVVDAQHGLSPMDLELARLLRKSRKPIVVVINKIDDDKHNNLAIEFDTLGFEHFVSISAAHGRGTTELLDTIEPLLPEGPTTALEAETEEPAPKIEPSLAVAIIGRPNAGKSSLINAVVHSERAIVSELPGTTRDAVDILYERKGEKFTFIDTAGMRRRGQHSTSVEVFSVMRAERSIRRADLCVLMVDLTSGVTAQDKRIAGLMQKSRKASVIILNKWDLFKPKRGEKKTIAELIEETRQRAFFLDYAPVLVASARTGENVDQVFNLIDRIRRAAGERIGTGVLNRLLRAAFDANPPPMVSGHRLKLFYATQGSGRTDRPLGPPEFVLFVNDPRFLSDTYRRYLEARIRKAQPYPGLPLIINCRPRKETQKK